MQPRTMSIGGATYDLFVRTTEALKETQEGVKSFLLPLGEKIRVGEVVETCGGGASNTSVGLARLGCTSGFCGIVGADQWGEKLLKNLRDQGVNVDAATVVEGEVSSFSIILTAPGGDRVILYAPGTNAHLHDATFDRSAASNVDWVYLNHIVEEACVIENDMIGILAREDGPRFTWNPGGCQVDVGIEATNNRALVARASLLLLNKDEALKFTKAHSTDEALRILTDIGAKNVCITDGKHGVIASDGKRRYRCPIMDTPVVETTGAGDAFGTGATWALLQGLDLPTALRAGTINAANVVGAIGAQAGLLTDIEMRARLNQVHLDVEENSLS